MRIRLSRRSFAAVGSSDARISRKVSSFSSVRVFKVFAGRAVHGACNVAAVFFCGMTGSPALPVSEASNELRPSVAIRIVPFGERSNHLPGSTRLRAPCQVPCLPVVRHLHIVAIGYRQRMRLRVPKSPECFRGDTAAVADFPTSAWSGGRGLVRMCGVKASRSHTTLLREVELIAE